MVLAMAALLYLAGQGPVRHFVQRAMGLALPEQQAPQPVPVAAAPVPPANPQDPPVPQAQPEAPPAEAAPGHRAGPRPEAPAAGPGGNFFRELLAIVVGFFTSLLPGVAHLIACSSLCCPACSV